MSDQADKVRADHRAAVARVHALKGVPANEKARRIRELDEAARKAMTDLRGQLADDEVTSQRQARRSAFGIADLRGDPAVLASGLRAAKAQVSGMNSRQAAALFADAEDADDQLIMRAVAAHAADQTAHPMGRLDGGWMDVLNAYVAARPTALEDVQAVIDGQVPPAGTGAANLFEFVIPSSDVRNLGGDAA